MAWVSSARAPLRRISVRESLKDAGWVSLITLLSDTAYHSFIGEVEALNTTTIRRLTPSCRHQILTIARRAIDQVAPQGAPLQRDTRPGRRCSVCRTRRAGRGQPVLFHAARPPQLSRAGYHSGHPRWAAAARFDGREAPQALTSAACLARSANRARLCVIQIRISKTHPTLSPERSWLCPDRPGTRHHTSLTAVLEFGPTETLPPVGAISKHPGVSADAVAKPSAQTRAESRVFDLRKRLRERDRLCLGGRWIRTSGPSII